MHGGDASAEISLCVDLFELGVEIGGHAVTELLYRVDSRRLKKFGKLSGYAFDPEKIGMIYPPHDQLGADPGLFGQLGAAFGGLAFFKKLLGSVDAGGSEFVGP